MKESDSECGGTFFERVRGGLREKERVGDSVSILDFGEYREFLGSEVRISKKKHQKKSRFERLSYITVPFVALCTLAHSSRFSLAHRLSAHCVPMPMPIQYSTGGTEFLGSSAQYIQYTQDRCCVV